MRARTSAHIARACSRVPPSHAQWTRRGPSARSFRSARPTATEPEAGQTGLAALPSGDLLALEPALALHVAPVPLDLLLALAASHAALRGRQGYPQAGGSQPLAARARASGFSGPTVPAGRASSSWGDSTAGRSTSTFSMRSAVAGGTRSKTSATPSAPSSRATVAQTSVGSSPARP